MLNEDDALDALKTQVFRELLTYMLQDPATIEPALDLILISRHLERIGDHATNVAEDVIFMVSARDVRHHAGDVERREPAPQPCASSAERLPAVASAYRLTRTVRLRYNSEVWRGPSRCACTAVAQPVDPAWRPFCSERCKMADLGAGSPKTTGCPDEPPPDASRRARRRRLTQTRRDIAWPTR